MTSIANTNDTIREEDDEKTPLINNNRLARKFSHHIASNQYTGEASAKYNHISTNNHNNKQTQPRDVQIGISWAVAAFLLVNAALGAGMLNYPYAYGQVGGVGPSAILQVILLVFVASTMLILIYCSDLNGDSTYHGVLMSMCGKRAQQMSALSILLTCFGINITFLVVIGDQYDRIFISLLPDQADYWYLDRRFTIALTALLFILPMCYAQRLEFLRYASTLGIFAMLYVAFLTVYEFYYLEQVDVGPIKTMPDDWLAVVTVIPIMCFAYQTHEVIVPVYACMRQRNMAGFMKASMFGLVILFFLYNMVGSYGYLTFGSNVDPDITSLYDGTDPIVVIGIVSLVIKIITTYPPLMLCGRGALDGLYVEYRQLSQQEYIATETTRRVIITTIWFITTVVLALYAPNISMTLQLLGSLASVNVFVFPGMCLIALTNKLRRARLAYLVSAGDDYDNNAATLFASNNRHHLNHHVTSQSIRNYYLVSPTSTNAANKRAKREYISDGSVSLIYDQIKGSTALSQQLSYHQAASNATCAQGGLVAAYQQQQQQQPLPPPPPPPPQLSTIKDNAILDNIHQDDQQQQQQPQQQVAPPNLSSSINCIGDNVPIVTMGDNHTICQSTGYGSHLMKSLVPNETQFSNCNRGGDQFEHSHVAKLAVTGISKSCAVGLYSFAAVLITFGVFIFILEVVSVIGFI